MSNHTNPNILTKLIDDISRIIVPQKTNFEIECRYSIDDRKKEDSRSKRFNTVETIKIAKKIIEKNKKNSHEIEQTINFIKNDIYIKQVPFVNGEQKKDKHIHYYKEKIIDPIVMLSPQDSELPTYKLVLTFEHETEEFGIKDCQMARIRLRYSIWFEQWRLDITLLRFIKTLNNPQELKSAKQEMLYTININDFNDNAPWDLTDMIEFEMEFIADRSAFSINSLKFVNSFMDEYIDASTLPLLPPSTNPLQSTNQSNTLDYQDTIYQVAKLIKPYQADKFRSKFGMKKLSNQVLELDKNMYMRDVQNNITNYYITDKIDGKRAILYITNVNYINPLAVTHPCCFPQNFLI
jgi:hypothetical protein